MTVKNEKSTRLVQCLAWLAACEWRKYSAKTLQVAASGASASSAATAMVLAILSLTHNDGNNKIPRFYYASMPLPFLIEFYRFWHDEGATADHNITEPGRKMSTPLTAASPLLSAPAPVPASALRRETPGRRGGALSPENSSPADTLKRQALYILFCTALTVLDFYNQLFVYISSITWMRNFNNSKTQTHQHQHYILLNYAVDLPIFTAFYALTWPFVFYGEISPTAREATGYFPEGKTAYFEALPAPMQKSLYVAGLGLHTGLELLPLFLLVSPEFVRSALDTDWGKTLVIGGGGLVVLVLGTLKLAITHYCEGDKFREEVRNSKLSQPTPSKQVTLFVKKIGAVMCLANYADTSLPINTFVRKDFFENQAGIALSIALGAGAFVAIAVFYGVYKQVCKEMGRSNESSPPSETECTPTRGGYQTASESLLPSNLGGASWGPA